MSNDQDPPDSPEKERFNPFINEADMFKVLLCVAGFCAIVALLTVLIRTFA